ncbi:hypothetical protein [Sporolactobacillus pectinivorans]|uniref:hypothetical protein n=1 Tax=Sporolactobacillus pectinivorans TaxID=1591408 RepID=UPI000C2674AA|nr:hypothetical protein [Sporolactobacillus pectinivorans]
MHQGDIVEIIYQDSNGKFSQRYIRIISASGTYVKAYCFTRHKIRTFLKARIFSVKQVKSA